MLHFYATLFEKALPFTLCYGKKSKGDIYFFLLIIQSEPPRSTDDAHAPIATFL
jgi:hypothetical protein